MQPANAGLALTLQNGIYNGVFTSVVLVSGQAMHVSVSQGSVVTFTCSNPDFSGGFQGFYLYSDVFRAKFVNVYEYDINPNFMGAQLHDLIPWTDLMTSTQQKALQLSTGVSGQGTGTIVWDTSSAASGLYYVATDISTFVTVFVASSTPTTITYSPYVVTTAYSTFVVVTAACLGDTLVLNKPTGSTKYTTLPYKDLYISCIPIGDENDPPAITVMASGPSPLTWTVAGIDASMQCFISYGAIPAGSWWAGPMYYSWLKLYPRPSPTGSASPCKNCSAGTFSLTAGASSNSTCIACGAGTYMTEQGGTACTACPASSNTTAAGRSRRGDCICDPGFVGNLTLLGQTCAICPANSYCAGLLQTPCPLHTHSPAQSSLQAHCRCDAGYKCRYGRDVQLVLRFSVAPATFASQEASIRAQIASLAGVPVSSVYLVQSALAAGRRMLEVTAYVARPGDGLQLV